MSKVRGFYHIVEEVVKFDGRVFEKTEFYLVVSSRGGRFENKYLTGNISELRSVFVFSNSEEYLKNIFNVLCYQNFLEYKVLEFWKVTHFIEILLKKVNDKEIEKSEEEFFCKYIKIFFSKEEDVKKIIKDIFPSKKIPVFIKN